MSSPDARDARRDVTRRRARVERAQSVIHDPPTLARGFFDESRPVEVPPLEGVHADASPEGARERDMSRRFSRALARALALERRASERGVSSSSAVTRADADEATRARVHRALYRARQRGFLELDIVVGEWATRTLRSDAVTESFLDAFDEVLAVENPELFKWLTRQAAAPRAMAENEAYASLAAHCGKFLDEKSSAEARAAHGREWIRGWNDSGAGNQ